MTETRTSHRCLSAAGAALKNGAIPVSTVLLLISYFVKLHEYRETLGWRLLAFALFLACVGWCGYVCMAKRLSQISPSTSVPMYSPTYRLISIVGAIVATVVLIVSFLIPTAQVQPVTRAGDLQGHATHITINVESAGAKAATKPASSSGRICGAYKSRGLGVAVLLAPANEELQEVDLTTEDVYFCLRSAKVHPHGDVLVAFDSDPDGQTLRARYSNGGSSD